MLFHRYRNLKYIFFFVANIANMEVQAQQTGTFRGKVSDNMKRPVSGVTITLEPDRKITQSDSQGNFIIPKLYPGVYQVRMAHVGFETYMDSTTIRIGDTTEQQIHLFHSSRTIDEVQIQGEVAVKNPSPDNLLKMERAGMPMQVITRRTIELMGSRRLDEILKEQTGMAIVNNVTGGSRSVGVQIQGFGSEYIMVLIDGQPMVGRNNGNFDLSRISVSNIERIEIVKGASSCLFGSEALGGAINIITRHGAIDPQIAASFNYGTLHIVDATVDAELPFAHQRGTINFSTNYYRTDGFNTNPYLKDGLSSPPYENYSMQTRIRYRTSKNGTVGSSIRYGLRQSYMPKNWGDGWISGDSQDEKDLNISFNYDHNFRSGWRSMSRYYLSSYKADEFVQLGDQIAANNRLQFKQQIHRFEQQFARRFKQGLQITAGIGAGLEVMDDEAIENAKDMITYFGYIQGDKRLSSKVNLSGGIRYDLTSNYGNKINPSLGLQYELAKSLTLKAGIGTGFKTPDFRMRYLVFFNPAANYLVIGNEVLGKTLNEMQDKGQISEIRNYVVNQLDRNLSAEKSTSYNMGLTWKPTATFSIESSVFYHQIRDQINAIQVATGTGVSQIFSYQNLPKAINKGLEISSTWNPITDLNLQFGYQYLISKDMSVIDSIRAGNWPYNQNLRDPKTGNHFVPRTSDYWGIENRSRHMFNIRAFYTYRPWNTSMSLRVNYRGKYAFEDYNGNQFIDRFDTFVPGHYLINTYIEKKLYGQHVTLRFTVDNLLNFKNLLMPGQAGRLFIGGLTYRWYKGD